MSGDVFLSEDGQYLTSPDGDPATTDEIIQFWATKRAQAFATLEEKSPIKKPEDIIIVCLKCGNIEPDEFTFWEYQAVKRDVLRIEDGKLIINGYYLGSESCKDPFFQCRKCGCEFNVGDIEMDFE